ncbi:hypothetical protein AVEN_168109-1, partial [Araneus ventricosus]
MANLEALKKSRKADIAAFTKAYNKVEELIALEGVDTSELEKEMNVLKVKVDCLEITRAIILELLPERDLKQNLKLLKIFAIMLYGLKLKPQGLSIFNNI